MDWGTVLRSPAKLLATYRWYVASAAVQLAFFPLGHWYDTRVFFVVGAATAEGQTPYGLYVLEDYFQHPHFMGTILGIGYAPPWALILGAVYTLTYALTGNLLVYNLGVKVPIILGNLLLAKVSATVLGDLGAPPSTRERASQFLLFNPFLLYVSSVWNMFDTIVTALAMLAVLYLCRGRTVLAAAVFAAAIGLKHFPIVLLPLLAVYAWQAQAGQMPWRRRIVALAPAALVFASVAAVAVYVPFFVFGWAQGNFVAAITYQAVATGNFTWYRLFGVTELPHPWLGYLWAIPVLAFTVYYARKRVHDTRTLFVALVVAYLGFTLTRTWVSEQNLSMAIPLLLVALFAVQATWVQLHVWWVAALGYAAFNANPVQLSFLVRPEVIAFQDALNSDPVFSIVRSSVMAIGFLVWSGLSIAYIIRHMAGR